MLPEERAGWTERLKAAETNLKQERFDVEAAGNAARQNQLGFIDDIVYSRTSQRGIEGALGEDAIEADARDSRDQVLKWSKSQEKATDGIKDIEQDLALLRDEIEEGGF